MSDGITDSEKCECCNRFNCNCEVLKELREASPTNIHEGYNQEIGDLKSIIDMRDEEINKLKDINKKLTNNMKSIREEDDRIIALKELEIKELDDTNHELWEMNNVLETSLKGYDKIVLDYPTLKKELEVVKKEIESMEEKTEKYNKIEHYWKDTPMMITFEEFHDEVKLILKNEK